MPRALISLISEQTLPNVLFIKQFGPFDRYIFLTTKEMEEAKRTDDVIKTCKIEGAEKLMTDAEKIWEVINKLKKEKIGTDTHLTINLTGGTKMMALGVYAHFTNNIEQLEIYYMPVQEPVVYKISPSGKTISLTAKVNLYEYLSAYGVKIIEEEKLTEDNTLFLQGEKLIAEIAKGKTPATILQATRNDYQKADKMFLTGAWLEIWLAHSIRQYFELNNEEISFNLKLTRVSGKSNEYTEYDVIFVRNNKLYVGECKYFSNGEFLKNKINKDWYKLAGLQLHMGLYATPFLATANRIPSKLNQYLLESHRLFRIKAFADIGTLGNKSKFHHFLNNL